MPKRPRSGAVSRPARVVAATSVKGLSGVQDLLDLGVEAVDFVDEQDLARLECREQRREVAGALDDRAGGGLDRDLELGGDHVGQAGLADAGRSEQEHVVERLA